MEIHQWVETESAVFTMDVASLTIDSRRLWRGEAVSDAPVAFVRLEGDVEVPNEIALPPCPVLGIGDPAHPLARTLDAVVESPITAEGLMHQVLSMPKAAAVIVQLLRLLPELPPEEGLTAESMAYALLQGSDEHVGWIASHRQGFPAAGPAGNVAIERVDDRLIVTLDRPAAGNAIDRAMRDQLYDAFSLAALDPDIARISLRGTGPTFSLGAELAEFGTTTDPATAHAIRGLTLPARQAARCTGKLDAHVQGGCVGAGLELAAYACRLTAAPNAWFQLPELAMGILPGAGGCVSLTHRIGRQRAALMMLSGKRLSARQALAWGLVDAIVDEAACD